MPAMPSFFAKQLSKLKKSMNLFKKRSRARKHSVDLGDMPYDVFLSISLYLSVKDLCFLRATSRYLASLVNEHSLWTIVLRDILEIQPIPRISSCLLSLSLEETKFFSIHLASQYYKVRNLAEHEHISFSWTRHLPPKFYYGRPIILPGGKYIITSSACSKNILLHDFDVQDIGHGWPLIPSEDVRYRITRWKGHSTSTTPNEFILAVVQQLTHADHTGPEEYVPRSHIYIYRCGLPKANIVRLDRFVIEGRISDLRLDSAFITLVWISSGTAYAYARQYHEKKSTPTMVLGGYHHDTNICISMLTSSTILVASTLISIYALPEMSPATEVTSESSVTLEPIWTHGSFTWERHDHPYIRLLDTSSDCSPLTTPPPRFMLWTGFAYQVFSLNSTASPDEIAYTAVTHDGLPKESSDVSILPPASTGKFSGIYLLRGPGQTERLWWTSFPIIQPHSPGVLRLTPWSTSDASGHNFAARKLDMKALKLEDEEFVRDVNMDEESGKVVIRIESERIGSTRLHPWRVVLAQL